MPGNPVFALPLAIPIARLVVLQGLNWAFWPRVFSLALNITIGLECPCASREAFLPLIPHTSGKCRGNNALPHALIPKPWPQPASSVPLMVFTAAFEPNISGLVQVWSPQPVTYCWLVELSASVTLKGFPGQGPTLPPTLSLSQASPSFPLCWEQRTHLTEGVQRCKEQSQGIGSYPQT